METVKGSTLGIIVLYVKLIVNKNKFWGEDQNESQSQNVLSLISGVI